MGWKLAIITLFFLAGCSTPKVERIEEVSSNQQEPLVEQEKEVKMPKLKFEDIPTTPQEQVIELQ